MTHLGTTPIVVIAFNRPDSLKRLLNSLSKAKYPNKAIPLIISIDKGTTNHNVLELAENFYWAHGIKTVRYQEANLGLRKHVIQCGQIVNEYGSVILLEDDLYVAKDFYYFASQALMFSCNKPYIGGVSLYNHQLNQHVFSYFSCIEDKYDNWYFQYAASWGQAWTKEQFSDFYVWYLENQTLNPKPEIPINVSNWSNKSWLKFFIAYLIKKDKYFMYPKISFTTNFGDSGIHFKTNYNTTYQIPLSYREKTKFQFSTIKESTSVYDSFFENKNLFNNLNLKKEELCVDLYGHKPLTKDKKYYLTSKILNFKIEKSFSRSLRPIDSNVIENIYGEDLFLYDTSQILKNEFKANKLKKLSYNFKAISYKQAIYLAIELVKNRFKSIIS